MARHSALMAMARHPALMDTVRHPVIIVAMHLRRAITATDRQLGPDGSAVCERAAMSGVMRPQQAALSSMPWRDAAIWTFEARNAPGDFRVSRHTHMNHRIMLPKNWLFMSRRPCPACGAQMQYKSTLLTKLTGRYRRICTRCGYADPKEVAI